MKNNDWKDFDKELHNMMHQVGWIIPQTPEQVLLAEKELEANPVELPESLSNPYALLEKHKQKKRGFIK